ncbi:uracil-DNA glycosylase [Nocardioides sp. zg-DK7169]|uniref:uracil-DNA glycosylase n=1 Tax=Nocardioides sp. zg-DK7169 TaxID=2736600 RepID=UPI001553FC1D|nr:uracil-DNA glycosylase [Nocardioides sp. zg-DK7169]
MTEVLPHPATGQPFASPVPPGTGWPGDPATAETPAATSAAGVRRLATELLDGEAASTEAALGELDARVSVCRACPRLVRWREDVAEHKRASYAAEPYWGRPIPGWGPADARIMIVGLAPAAQGGNRTGRIFTGDRSGDWLFASLHRVGLAAQATSVDAADGQALRDTRMVATVRCAPPQNRPTPQERATCSSWLDAELDLLAGTVRVAVTLGAVGWAATLSAFGGAGWEVPRPRPRFGHGAEVLLPGSAERGRHDVLLLGSYHPSQHNTFTGRLTGAMLDEVLGRAKQEAATMPR